MSRRDYWRSLEELAETPDFLAFVREKAPRFAAAAATLDRRRFLELMAASMALGGLAGCGPEEEPRDLLPYVEEPPGIVPGRARAYATASLSEGVATGVLVTHQMGRPIKIEGNPDHPASRGATSAIEQASILGLYDPQRAQSVLGKGQLQSWEAFVATLTERRRALLAKGGEGLRLLTGSVTSPWLAAQLALLQGQFPALRWHQWEPLHRDNERAAATLAFGKPLAAVLDLAQADVILAVEGDFLSAGPGHLAYARDFAARRRPAEANGEMSRLYAVESTPTLAGAKADHRLALAPDAVEAALRHLAGRLGAGPAEWATSDAPHAAWCDAVAADLGQHRGRALIHAGREQSAAVHAIALALNDALGAFGATLHLIEPPEAAPIQQQDSLAAVVADMRDGKVDTLVMLETNPVYTAPADVDFTAALGRVPFSASLALYADETACASTWHIPAAHDYERWGDARAFDGTVTLIQPQVRPLYGGRSAHELLAVLAGDTLPDPRASLADFWRLEAQHRELGDFADLWHESLRSGVVAKSAAAPVAAKPRADLAAHLPPAAAGDARGWRLLFRGDAALGDGRYAENAWLQELPRPLTRLTWDNAALIAPATAQELGVATGDIVAIAANGASVEAPVFVLPGQAAGCVTLPLGFGRRAGSAIAAGVGFDAYRLRRAGDPWSVSDAALAKTGRAARLASVQGHDRIAGRDLVREGDLAAFRADPHLLARPSADVSLYPAVAYEGDAWAMAIDLNSCIGCQACVAACQAENNIPVVGKEQVLAGREMHWLRIDRYYSGSPDAPSIAFEPVPCMHCENAPCEVVCPVHATVHDHEGLNAMVYNRCVGTRFCSNNCPYKVRRFNFFAYAKEEKRPAESWNPDVTVRDRGVMEKCTYCLQRIRSARIAADRDNRELRDGDIVTACQQACPAEAIVFGNKNDAASAVARRKANPLDFVLLDELNTRPRTSYAAIIRNRNPDLPEDEA
jgi:molybdopterin-containing oxidoreductase family iron-sulfur binding subunit